MKFLLSLSLFFYLDLQAQTLKGQITTSKVCSQDKVMVWLSLDKVKYQETVLLSHTLVPINGTFGFEVRPGKYLIRATDELGCEAIKRIEATQSQFHEFDLKLMDAK